MHYNLHDLYLIVKYFFLPGVMTMTECTPKAMFSSLDNKELFMLNVNISINHILYERDKSKKTRDKIWIQ